MKGLFRIIIFITLAVNFYNGFLGGFIDRFSTSTWGSFKSGPFWSVVLFWGGLELVNYISAGHGVEIPAMIWVFVAAGLVVDSFSDYLLLYEKLRHYDKFLHFLIGGVVVGFLVMRILGAFMVQTTLPLWVKYWLVILLTNFLGFVYEFFELITDRFYGAYNILNRFDTTEDMLLNMLGALTFILISHFFFTTKKAYSEVKTE